MPSRTGSIAELREYFADPRWSRVYPRKDPEELMPYKRKKAREEARKPVKPPPVQYEPCPRCLGRGKLPLGKSMRAVRIARRLSLEHVAKRIGCSLNHVHDLEMGDRAWSGEMAKKYLKACRVK